MSKNDCSACETGRFSSEKGVTKCLGLCSVGKFSNEVGLRSDIQCQGLCSIGKFSTTTGLTHDANCTACPEGKTSPVGSIDCRSCPPGTIAKTEIPLLCEGCEAGKFQPIPHSSKSVVCDPCPIGKFIEDHEQKQSLHDSIDDCTTCPKGYEVKDVTQCQVCKYSTFQNESNVAGVKCSTCPENTYITDDRSKGFNHEREEDCVSCSVGKYTLTTGGKKLIPVPYFNIVRRTTNPLFCTFIFLECYRSCV